MEPREISFFGYELRRSRENVEKWELSCKLYVYVNVEMDSTVT